MNRGHVTQEKKSRDADVVTRLTQRGGGNLRVLPLVSQEKNLRGVCFVTCLTPRESSRELSFGSQDRKLRDVAFLTCLTQSREVSVLSQQRHHAMCAIYDLRKRMSKVLLQMQITNADTNTLTHNSLA